MKTQSKILFVALLIIMSCTNKKDKFLGTWQKVIDPTTTFIIRASGGNFILENTNGKKSIAFYNKEYDKLEINADNGISKIDFIYDEKTQHLIGAGEEYSKIGEDNKTKENKADDKFGTFTDSRDGKVYKTVKIGTQTWMAENLAYKTSGGCWANNNDKKNIVKYGYLYTWETAKNACPSGWHLPSDVEWTTLINYLGGIDVAGGKLKATSGWGEKGNGSDESGFSALPGGSYNSEEGFAINLNAIWWTSTEKDANYAWPRYLNENDKRINKGAFGESKQDGLSVRCIKD